jgi:hypothetical protein
VATHQRLFCPAWPSREPALESGPPAVVAQVLTYATYLHGLDRAELERTVLGGHLRRRGYDADRGGAGDGDQERSLGTAAFDQGVAKT